MSFSRGYSYLRLLAGFDEDRGINLRKTICVLISILLTAVISGCNENENSSEAVQIISAVEYSEVSAEESEEEEIPVVKKLNCFEKNCNILSITDVNDGQLAVLYVCYKNDNSYEYIVSYIDIKNDKILDEVKIPSDLLLVGVRNNGQLLMNNVTDNNLVLYDNKGTLAKVTSIPSDHFVFDKAEDKIYCIGSKLECYEFSGKHQTLISMTNNDEVLAVQPESGLALISCQSSGDCFNEQYQTVLYSYKDKKITSYMPVNEDVERYEFCGDEIIAQSDFYEELASGNYSKQNVLSSYSINGCKLLNEYEVASDYILQKLNDNGLYVGINHIEDTSNDKIRVVLINADKGLGSYFNDLDKSYDYQAYYLDSCKSVALSGKKNEGETSVIYIVDPQRADYSIHFLKHNTKNGNKDEKERTSTIGLGEQLAGLRKKADELEKKYSIKILLGNEIKNCNCCNGFRMVSTEDSSYTFEHGADGESVDKMLEHLDVVLSGYSKDFFEKFRDFKGEGGIRIAIIDRFVNDEGNFLPSGIFSRIGAWYNIVVDSQSLEELQNAKSNLDHEIWHAAEKRVCDNVEGAFNEEDWMKFNEEGFEYKEDFEDYFSDGSNDQYIMSHSTVREKVCMIYDYSTVASTEDRATLAEFILGSEFDPDYYSNDSKARMYNTCFDYAMSFKHMKNKYEYMKKYTDMYFGDTYFGSILQ